MKRWLVLTVVLACALLMVGGLVYAHFVAFAGLQLEECALGQAKVEDRQFNSNFKSSGGWITYSLDRPGKASLRRTESVSDSIYLLYKHSRSVPVCIDGDAVWIHRPGPDYIAMAKVAITDLLLLACFAYVWRKARSL